MTKDDKSIYKNLLKKEKENIKKIKSDAKGEEYKLTKEDINEIKRRQRERTVARILRRKLPEKYENEDVKFTDNGNVVATSKKESRIISQIRKDLNQISTNNLMKKIAIFLASVGVAIGTVHTIAPPKEDKAIETEVESETEKETEVETEVETETTEQQETTTAEMSTEEKVYEELANLSEDEAKRLFKNIYADLYEEQYGESIDASQMKILYSNIGTPYIVTLEDGSQVALTDGGSRTEEQEIKNTFEELGLDYTKFANCYAYKYIYNDETLEESLPTWQIVSLEDLVAYVNGEIESIPSIAYNIFREIEEPMISLMMGHEISDEARQTVANWITDLGYEYLIIDEEEKEEENETISSNSTSDKEKFLSDLKVEEYTTSLSNEDSYDVEIDLNEEKTQDDDESR